MAKKYYWLKLKNTFFNQKEIKLLRRIAGGDTYTVIYLKMMLLSLEDEGTIYFDNVADNFIEELALDLDEDTENVDITLRYLQAKGLLEVKGTDEYFLNEVPTMIGKESDSAERVRRHRKKKKELDELHSNEQALHSNNDVTQSKSKSKELDLKQEKEFTSAKITSSLQDDAPSRIGLKSIPDKRVQHYAAKYFEHFNQNHPQILLNKVNSIIADIAETEFRDSYIEPEDIFGLIDYHFDNLAESNDGKIYSFLHEEYRNRIANDYLEQKEEEEDEYPF